MAGIASEKNLLRWFAPLVFCMLLLFGSQAANLYAAENDSLTAEPQTAIDSSIVKVIQMFGDKTFYIKLKSGETFTAKLQTGPDGIIATRLVTGAFNKKWKEKKSFSWGEIEEIALLKDNGSDYLDLGFLLRMEPNPDEALYAEIPKTGIVNAGGEIDSSLVKLVMLFEGRTFFIKLKNGEMLETEVKTGPEGIIVSEMEYESLTSSKKTEKTIPWSEIEEIVLLKPSRFSDSGLGLLYGPVYLLGGILIIAILKSIHAF